jgi:basic membrane lipoprotein Med (substrate-binding protein (PBP1-ABC) superfamily)
LAIQKELPWVDLSIRKDSMPDDNKQAVEDLLESMVQQGAKVVYTTSFGFMEPTRIAGKPEIAALYDERGQWFVENVVGSPTP